jgi:hypothetical protein
MDGIVYFKHRGIWQPYNEICEIHFVYDPLTLSI